MQHEKCARCGQGFEQNMDQRGMIRFWDSQGAVHEAGLCLPCSQEAWTWVIDTRKDKQDG